MHLLAIHLSLLLMSFAVEGHFILFCAAEIDLSSFFRQFNQIPINSSALRIIRIFAQHQLTVVSSKLSIPENKS
jgi:hypothetical protein